MCPDMWLWLGEGIEGFTANSAFSLLETLVPNRIIPQPLEVLVFKNLWKSPAPSKVCAFSWQLLLDRIQTKDNLRKQRMLQNNNVNCVFCGSCAESGSHLFLHCDCASKVWYQISRWLGLFLILPHNVFTSFALLITSAKNKKEKMGLCLIWNAYVWVIWIARNDGIFNAKVWRYDEVVEQIKLLSWKWFIGRMATGPCLLYEWNWSPLDCMQR
ncbi:hypothetical protein TSUD_107350 [Trifolium subterraneum]|uniref:Reverse transcriptase zinc-binding domain-containing protein n=1 Tax=Trifolium subterraneum TaxID=3900 RepID=A0A2Z6NTG5_TRISU|nr:hypothetical protein TSUD_107350 [Trifolium subterraneum]